MDTAAESQPRTGRLHGVRPERYRLAAGRLPQRTGKRRVPPLQQTGREELRANVRHRLRGLSEPPPERDAGAGRFAIPDAVLGVADHGASRRPERRNVQRLGTRIDFGPPAREAIEREVPQTVVQPLRSQRSRAQEDRVGGPVVTAVISSQGLVFERRDRPGVSSGVEPVRSAGKQGTVQCLLQLPLGLAHHPPHLAQHHAAPLRRVPFPALRIDFDAASFLLEVEPVEARKERGVHVDRKQVLVVGKVPGGEVVGGAVLGGRGVHGRAQRAAQHREERTPAWITLAAAQHHVLEDVGETARIRGRGAESHQEGVVVQWRVEMEVPGAGRRVDVLRELPVERGDSRAIPAFEARWCG